MSGGLYRGAAVVLIATGLGATAVAAPLPPPPEMELVGQRAEERDGFLFPVAPLPSDASEEGGMRLAEGALAISVWRGDRGAGDSPSAIIEGYRQALEEEGWRTVFDCVDTDCGGVRRRFALELFPAPAMLLDTADLALLTVTFVEDEAADGADWDNTTRLGLVASRVLGQVYLQAALISPEGTPPPSLPGPGQPEPSAAETEAAASEIATEPLQAPGLIPGQIAGSARPAASPSDAAPWDDPEALAEVLIARGHLALSGIDFASGTATLSPSSAPAIARAAAIIAAAGQRPLAIVGHSDNDGQLAPNVDLSQRRADAVRTALIAEGVAEAQLEAHGVGWLAPLASNETPEGRAENRRVELVLR
ncbi:MAG: OmpA family protein [Pseudomonadota bacterium]